MDDARQHHKGRPRRPMRRSSGDTQSWMARDIEPDPFTSAPHERVPARLGSRDPNATGFTEKRTIISAASAKRRALVRSPDLVDQSETGFPPLDEALGRRRTRTDARPLRTVDTSRLPALDREDDSAWSESAYPLVPVRDAPVPDDVVRIPHRKRARRPPRSRRSLGRGWGLLRGVLCVAAVVLALTTAYRGMGEPSQPLMLTFETGAGGHDVASVASSVQPETQGMRPDLYDSYAQFQDWWDAACSAATLSEVLTAWGVHGASIGKLIDVMQPDISLYGGLLRASGYQRGASVFGYRADIRYNLTYPQILYIANVLGLPVIVNVRIAYGYYHFFDTGHFLVVTGGDSQGVKIVDSSEYYIHYLPLDVFRSMFTGMTVVIVPSKYDYTIAV